MMKRFFKWIKENIFDIKPIFKIKIETSWFSDDYVCIKYSNDNGHRWYVITTSESDIDENRWRKLKVDTRYIRIEDVEDFIRYNDLETYEGCCKLVSKVYDEVVEHNKVAYENYLNRTEPAREFIKKFNEK